MTLGSGNMNLAVELPTGEGLNITIKTYMNG